MNIKLPDIRMIYSIDKHKTLGLYTDNRTYDQPFHSNEDFKFFRHMIRGTYLIVGYNTYNIIKDYEFKHKGMIVIDRTENSFLHLDKKGRPIVHTNNLYTGFNILDEVEIDISASVFMCIGGKSTYEMCEPICNTFYVTEWDTAFNLDIYEQTTGELITELIYYKHKISNDLWVNREEVITDICNKTGVPLKGIIKHYKRGLPTFVKMEISI